MLLTALFFAFALTQTVKKSEFDRAITSRYFLGATGESILALDLGGTLVRSSNFGESWTKLTTFDGPVLTVKVHENDNTKMKVFVSTGTSLWYSSNAGESWTKVNPPVSTVHPNTLKLPLLDFHPTNAEWFTYMTSTDCPASDCHSVAYLTTDNGNTWTEITKYAEKCIFAKDTKFTHFNDKDIFCTRYRPAAGDQSRFRGDARTFDGHNKQLVLIDQYMKETVLSSNVIEFYVFEQFLGVAAEEDKGVFFKSARDGDTLKLDYAKFPPHAFDDHKPSSYTILQSPSNRIFIDALVSSTYSKEMSILMVSDQTGSYFTYSLNHTNRAFSGLVDYERVQGIPGVILANQVANFDEVVQGKSKKVVTKISYNDGATWDFLYACAERSSSCQLHLHNRAELSPDGPIYSIKSSSLLVADGNEGDSLLGIDQSATYSSRDGGKTWQKIAKGQTYHEIIARGSIIVAAPVFEATNYLYYLDREGFSGDADFSRWNKIDLGGSFLVSKVIGVDDGRGKKVIVFGYGQGTHKDSSLTINFASLASCSKDDTETWAPKDCFFGQKQSLWRRKLDKTCVVSEDISVVPQGSCTCSSDDVECDIGFVVDGNECKPVSTDALKEPPSCIQGQQFDGPSGYRLIPASVCTQNDDFKKKYMETKKYTCKGGASTPIDSDKTGFTFDSEFVDIIYVTNTTVVLGRLADGSVWISKDIGQTWSKQNVPNMNKVVQNSYFDRMVYMFPEDGKSTYLFESKAPNEVTTTIITLPDPPSTFQTPTLEFNAIDPDFIIYFGNHKCDSFFTCHVMAYFTHDGGKTKWEQLRSYVTNCQWGIDSEFRSVSRDRVYCVRYNDQNGNQLMKRTGDALLEYSDQYFAAGSEKKVFESAFNLAVNEKFIVAAIFPDNDRSKLVLKITSDGDDWKDAIFPPGVDLSNGYTVVESHSGTLTLSIHRKLSEKASFAVLYVSESTGSQYSLSQAYANRDDYGYVDYERMLGVEGLAILNIVANPNSVINGADKQLTSVITYNNGGSWRPLAAPEDLKKGCSEPCSLHLQGYTRRSKTKNEVSDTAAAGIFIGVGNVGKELKSYEESDVFMSIDAGRTWTKVPTLQGPHLFEFGDHGNLLIFVPSNKFVTSIFYSFDFGKTVSEMKFGNLKTPFKVNKILTEPDSTSLAFVLVGTGESDGKTIVVPVVFEPTKWNMRLCSNATTDSDYEKVKFSDPSGDACVFGRVTEYWRRRQDRQCFIGDEFAGAPPTIISKTCDCQDEDFECAVGFYKWEGKECLAMENQQSSGWTDCMDGFKYYNAPIRKNSLSTCKNATPFFSKYEWKSCSSSLASSKTSAVLIVFLVIIPLAIFLAGGFWVYRKHQRGEPIQIRVLLDDGLARIRGWLPERFRGSADYEPVSTQDNMDMLMDDY